MGEDLSKVFFLKNFLKAAVMGEKPESLLPSAEPISLRDMHPVEVTLLEFVTVLVADVSQQVARQMALMSFDVYSRISSSELLQRRWLMAHKVSS